MQEKQNTINNRLNAMHFHRYISVDYSLKCVFELVLPDEAFDIIIHLLIIEM